VQYRKNFYQIRSNEYILQKLKEEQDSIGYYKLPFADTSYIKEYAKSITKETIVVIGIGGSSLGASAIYDFLKIKNNLQKRLLFLETTDPIDIKSKIDSLDFDDTLFLAISKSGTTVETISILKYLSTIVEFDRDNLVVISEANTPLDNYARELSLETFEVPKDVGGRFSVFSVVGLLPLAIIGVDIDNMLNGAKKVYDSFFNQDKQYEILMEKARFIVENKNRFNINVVFSYLSALDGFNKWYVQLWAESLGKININNTRQGLTPIGLVGPIDQHSFLQLIMEGKRDKTVTFIKVADFQEQIIVPQDTPIKELSYLEGISFSKLIDMQADATIEAIDNERDIPYDVITIDKIDEYNIAELMYTYELLVSIIGAFLQIDTYNQPGVESGKVILKEKLKEMKEIQ
jgi:glucose-6-phosphate isomerase